MNLTIREKMLCAISRPIAKHAKQVCY